MDYISLTLIWQLLIYRLHPHPPVKLLATSLLCFAQRSRSNLPRLAYKQACRLALCRLSGAGNNPQVFMTVAVAVAVEEASK